MNRWLLVMLSSVMLLSGGSLASASDWPLYRGNAARQARTDAALPEQLAEHWCWRALQAPQPAWPRSPRMLFDRAYHVVADSQRVYFGSSADGSVRALDLQSGATVWTFLTDGPVRFAPALWQDRVFVASDDGFLYALSTSDGSVLWKRRGGPSDELILGNERLISKWPARGGPVVVNDTVYFGAGIWPSDGIYLYALDASTGEPRWVNSDSGSIYMPQPHGGANAASGISSQGYLVVSGDHLLVPTGRAVPASFDLRTGKFEYFHLQKYGHNGGAQTMAVGDMFFNGGLGFQADSGDRRQVLPGEVAATEQGLVRAGGGVVEAFRWVDKEGRDRRGEPITTRALEPLWKLTGQRQAASLAVAAGTFVAAGDGYVDRIVLQDGQPSRLPELPVEGVAYGLAVAHQRLLVSTDRGAIYCFGDPASRPPQAAPPQARTDTPSQPQWRQAAETILARSELKQGVCVDLGCGDGSLALEIVRRSQLTVHAVDDDPENVATARQRLMDAGMYGVRATVSLRDLQSTSLPPYMADLAVSQRALSGSLALPAESRRLARPYGGIICSGTLDDPRVEKAPDLPGAGQWTHQYADPANSLNSGDQLVQGRLGMLWFRDVDWDVPQRHGRAPAPLFHQGRLFHEGINGIVAVNAYNGQELWRYRIDGILQAYDGDELMGTAGTGSNFCVHQDSVLIRDKGRCLRLDAARGTLLAEYALEDYVSGEAGEMRGPWGFLAAVDGVLYGTEADPRHVVTYRYRDTSGDMSQLLTESLRIFAIDIESGRRLWQYDAKDSIRHNAIAIGGGRVFLIDRPQALFDREKRPQSKEHPPGRLMALDARSGQVKWQVDEEVFGTMLAYSEPHDALLMSYQPTRFRLDSEIGGQLAVLQGSDGQRLWDEELKYESRPMINQRTVYAQGGAWDLLTGEPRPFPFRRSYGCGILTGSRSLMLFRSATLGYWDLQDQQSVNNYGGVRPGCWVNAIPAGGLVLVPDASAGCQCSYLNRTWFALQPLAEEKGSGEEGEKGRRGDAP